MIYFVGAGPGDPELITVKGKKLLEKADVIIYAGSLVNPKILQLAREDCQIYNSAEMNLEEQLTTMKEAQEQGLEVVRLHTGDPALYGAIGEQMAGLDKAGLNYQVVAGVSSYAAAAAYLKKELTVPEKTQTVILTRQEGRTPVPEEESLDKLAAHQSSMVIFLSIGMLSQVIEKLSHHYPPETPVAVVYKVSWPAEEKIIGTLATIEEKMAARDISRTALIMVGEFLDSKFDKKSKLYDKNFSHEYRSSATEKQKRG